MKKKKNDNGLNPFSDEVQYNISNELITMCPKLFLKKNYITHIDDLKKSFYA